MRRAIPYLRGLAILGVVFNHANWHVLSRFTAGQAQGYPFVVFDQLGKFAIPAFMFITGHFIAYTTSGGKHDLRWQVIWARFENLLWPWLIWSAILVVGQSFQGRSISLAEFLRNLIVQYYFIPLLIFYYLLAPWVARCARRNAGLLLAGAAVVQLLAVALFYARVYHPHFPGVLKSWVDLGPLEYLRFAFYFPFGIVCGMFSARVKESLARFKPILPWLTLCLCVFSVVESVMVYHMGGDVWPIGGDQTRLSAALFSTALICCFVALDKLPMPFSRTINELGTHSYGLYLCHYPILGIIAKVIQHATPWVASQEWLLLPLLFGLTVALSMLLMAGMSRLPTKRFYRYLFG